MADLTPRQQQIAQLVERGMSSRQIAKRLRISQRTVEAHRYHINQRRSRARGRRAQRTGSRQRRAR